MIGNSQIPTALGQTITGALANIPFPFGIDSNGNYGYKKAGADTVVPFKSGTVSSDMSFKYVSRATSLQLTGVQPDTLLIVIFNTCKAHQPVTSSISFGANQVNNIRSFETLGAFGGIVYGRNLIITADTLTSTINIAGSYDSSDQGYVSSLSALYVAG